MKIRALLAAAILFTLTACARPPDTITEIETGRNGVKVEIQDGTETYFRHGIDCVEGDRLSECTKPKDLLVEQAGARDDDR